MEHKDPMIAEGPVELILEKVLHELQAMRVDFQKFDLRVSSLEQDRVRAQQSQTRALTGLYAIIGTTFVLGVGAVGDYMAMKNRIGEIEKYGSPNVRKLEERVSTIEAKR